MPTQSSTTVASRLIVAATVAALSLSACAADITWEAKTGDWTQDELWDGGVAPGPEDTASFKSGEMTITNAVEFGPFPREVGESAPDATSRRAPLYVILPLHAAHHRKPARNRVYLTPLAPL